MKNKHKLIFVGALAALSLTACKNDKGTPIESDVIHAKVDENNADDTKDVEIEDSESPEEETIENDSEVGKDDKFQVEAKASSVAEYIKSKGYQVTMDNFDHIPHEKINSDEDGDSYKYPLEGGFLILRVTKKTDSGPKVTRVRLQDDAGGSFDLSSDAPKIQE